MDVHLVWHIRHERRSDGIEHQRDGELYWDESLGDDVKLLGVFSSRDGADTRVEQARDQPGFRDEPDCFVVDRYRVDTPAWPEGFGWVEEPVDQPKS